MKIPKNLKQCYEALETELMERDHLKEFVNASEEDIALLHHSFGQSLRNSWGLWRESVLAKYFRRMGICHADDMSHIILLSFHRKMNKRRIRLQEQIEHYRAYWEKMGVDPCEPSE